MNIVLAPEEARVIGCLMEKAVTTPDQCPLTLNALTNACNQKSARDPVMKLTQGEVQGTTRHLKDKFLLTWQESGSGSVEKYSQRLCNTPMASFQLDQAEYAIVCLLLLRGPQTPGELRARSGRLAPFDDNQQVVETLQGLMAGDDPVVARLARKPGRQDHEYAHLLSGELESVQEQITTATRATPERESSLRKLEARVERLEDALLTLAERLGEDIDLERGHDDEPANHH